MDRFEVAHDRSPVAPDVTARAEKVEGTPLLRWHLIGEAATEGVAAGFSAAGWRRDGRIEGCCCVVN